MYTTEMWWETHPPIQSISKMRQAAHPPKQIVSKIWWEAHPPKQKLEFSKYTNILIKIQTQNMFTNL